MSFLDKVGLTSCLHSLHWLFFIIALSFSFLKAILKGLKQLTSNGLKAWEVGNDNVIVSNPNSYAYSIVFNETCDPHPFKALIDLDCILWCHLDWPIE